MRNHGPCLALLTMLTALAWANPESVHAQYPLQPMFLPPSPPPPAPLLYVRFAGPRETKLTIYRGFDAGQTLELPCTVGFRPGYAYRLAISDVPGFPRQVFFPTLEVRGTLALVPKLRNADFPAQINFTAEEFAKVMTGTFIKKVVVVERPDHAVPIATRADAPLEIPVSASLDPLAEGTEHGQPVIVFHLGRRFLTPLELNTMGIPGTVLLPGERVLGTPRQPPWLVWNWCQVYDPVYGPRHPAELASLNNGGASAPLGYDGEGKLKGLNPSDTVAQYRDSRGKQRLAVSNRVALCIPRFLVFKSETVVAAQRAHSNIVNALASKTSSDLDGQMSSKEQSQQTHSEAVAAKQRASGAFNLMGTSVFGRALGVDVKSSLRSVEYVDVIAAQPMKSEPADGPLRIIKWPDKKGAAVGGIVTFFLKYTNTGGQPITGVVVSDSLTARFEYVKGSAESDRAATFTMQKNAVGSDVLRWEMTTTLQPRESGMISFQVRIR